MLTLSDVLTGTTETMSWSDLSSCDFCEGVYNEYELRCYYIGGERNIEACESCIVKWKLPPCDTDLATKEEIRTLFKAYRACLKDHINWRQERLKVLGTYEMNRILAKDSAEREDKDEEEEEEVQWPITEADERSGKRLKAWLKPAQAAAAATPAADAMQQ